MIIEGPYDVGGIEPRLRGEGALGIGIAVIKDFGKAIKIYGKDSTIAEQVNLAFAYRANYWLTDVTSKDEPCLPAKKDLKFGVMIADIEELVAQANKFTGCKPFEVLNLDEFFNKVINNPAYANARGFQWEINGQIYKEVERLDGFSWRAYINTGKLVSDKALTDSFLSEYSKSQNERRMRGEKIF